MQASQRDTSKQRLGNKKTGFFLASVALVFFLGIVLKKVLIG
jgi:hypothetical protein